MRNQSLYFYRSSREKSLLVRPSSGEVLFGFGALVAYVFFIGVKFFSFLNRCFRFLYVSVFSLHLVVIAGVIRTDLLEFIVPYTDRFPGRNIVEHCTGIFAFIHRPEVGHSVVHELFGLHLAV
jgi:hypothetical protein